MTQMIGGSLLILKGEDYDYTPIDNWDDGIQKYFDNIKNLDAYIADDAAARAFLGSGTVTEFTDGRATLELR